MFRHSLLLLFFALPLAAQTDVAVWGARASSSTTHAIGGDIRFDRGSGFGVSVSRFGGDHLALELSAFDLRQRGTVSFDGVDTLDLGELRLRPVALTLQWHFNHRGTLDPYLGAGAAYVFTGDLSSAELTSSGVGTVTVKNGLGALANGGVSYSISDTLAVGIDVKVIRF